MIQFQRCIIGMITNTTVLTWACLLWSQFSISYSQVLLHMYLTVPDNHFRLFVMTIQNLVEHLKTVHSPREAKVVSLTGRRFLLLKITIGFEYIIFPYLHEVCPLGKLLCPCLMSFSSPWQTTFPHWSYTWKAMEHYKANENVKWNLID